MTAKNNLHNLSLMFLKQDLFENCRHAFWACLPLSLYVLANSDEERFSMNEFLKDLEHVQSLVHMKRHGMSVEDAKFLLFRMGVPYKWEKIPNGIAFKRLQLLLKKKAVLIFPPGHAICALENKDQKIQFFEPDDLENEITSMCESCFKHYWFGNQKYLQFIYLK